MKDKLLKKNKKQIKLEQNSLKQTKKEDYDMAAKQLIYIDALRDAMDMIKEVYDEKKIKEK